MKETKSKKTKSEDNKGANFQPVPDEGKKKKKKKKNKRFSAFEIYMY